MLAEYFVLFLFKGLGVWRGILSLIHSLYFLNGLFWGCINFDFGANKQALMLLDTNTEV